MSPEPRTCERCLVFAALEDVAIIDLERSPSGLVLTIETTQMVIGCPSCGTVAKLWDRRPVRLVDLPCFGRPTTTVWLKKRFVCADAHCGVRTFTEQDDRIAPRRSSLMTRAGRWATHRVGAHARSIAEVADDLGCSWHAVNRAVVAWGEALNAATISPG